VNKPDHSQTCTCYPCQLRRKIEALEDACLPPLDDLDGLPDCLGDCGEAKGYED
jgi:hypothetical protein